MNNKIFNVISKLENRMINDRRSLHQNPETEFEEFNTQRYIVSRLKELNLDFKTGIAKTGTLVTIKGKIPGKAVLLRADIDALDIEEKNNVEYKSKTKGKMHACGHDAHTAIMLSVCEALSELKDDLCGTVKVVFQPAEEGAGGAKPMIEEGIMENPKVDACLALHVDPGLEVGKIRVKEGSVYGSPDEFELIIKGRGGHGAEPHLCIDPILVASHVVMALQSIVSRRISPFDSAVVSICAISGGSNTNVIPDSVRLLGTARSLTNEIRDSLPVFIEDTVKNICGAFKAEYELNFLKLFPPTINDSELANIVKEVAINRLGIENVIWGGLPTMAGEDFSYYGEKAPSVIYKLGCRNDKKGINKPLHNSEFNIDEDCLKVGALVILDAAFKYLNKA